MSIRSEKMTFVGAQGEPLAARFEVPDSPRGVAIFAHCFACSKDFFAPARISRALAERGVAVLRFDFTGLGSSAGDFANTNFSSNVEDLIAAAAHLRRIGRAPALLVGHSFGGSAALIAAPQIPEVCAIATIGAPFDPGHVRTLLEPTVAAIEAQGEASVRLAGRSFRVTSQFLRDLESHRPQDISRNLAKPVLVMHSPTDPVVPVAQALNLFSSLPHPKSFVALDGADHLLTRREDATYVAEVIAAWGSRYLNAPQDHTLPGILPL